MPSARTPILTTLLELQTRILRPDELLCDFYLGPRRTYLFAVSPDSIRVVPLPAEVELIEAVRLCSGFLRAPANLTPSADDVATLELASRALSEALFGEVADLVARAEHVIICPDGILHAIPLAALPGLLEAVARTSRIPSASILAMLRRTATTDAPATFVALAGETTDQGEELRGAVEEVHWLARAFRNVTPYVVPRDSAALGPDWLRTAGLLHIASHLHMDDQNPWQSAIRLMPARNTGDLRAADIARMDLSAHLAVLASCESASGLILSGEGVLGLASAFLSAGVPAVLATLWPVDDDATAHFMKCFYTHLGRGQPVTHALREAQCEMRSRVETSHPYYWAGFVLIGEGDQRVALQRRTLRIGKLD
jgi:CHAT domain-containing protein